MTAGYEKSDVSLKAVFIGSVIFIVLLVALLIGASEYFTSYKENLIQEVVLKPESDKLLKLRAYEDNVLTSYGVVDKNSDIYRIPIDQAISLIARQ